MARRKSSGGGCITVFLVLAAIGAVLKILAAIGEFIIEHGKDILTVFIVINIIGVVGLIIWLANKFTRKKQDKAHTDYTIRYNSDNWKSIGSKNQLTTGQHTAKSSNGDNNISEAVSKDLNSTVLSNNTVENNYDYQIEKLKSKHDYDFDRMSGRNFEFYCAKLLRKNGFSHVEVTQASRDKGVDIIAYRKKDKYAIQCKFLSNGNVGMRAIQEVYTGKRLYKCTKAMVMTNSKYSDDAIKNAFELNVILINGITLSEWQKN